MTTFYKVARLVLGNIVKLGFRRNNIGLENVPEKGGFPDNSASDSLLPVCLGSRRQLSETSFVKTHISEEHFS